MELTDQIPAPKEPQKADCPSASCSVVMAQCDTCRDMAEFRRDELPTACGWSGCGGVVTEKINPPNVERMRPLPASAEDDKGKEVHTTEDAANTAAGSGLHGATCSPSDSSCDGVIVERLFKPLPGGGQNQVFMIEVGHDYFDHALDSTNDDIQKNIQEWEQDGLMNQVAAWLLLKGMGHRKAKEVLSSCNTSVSE